ncbi:MAG: hypothetical protein A3I73_03655 [Omnitrophica bacterium RIFCSPLOWO2_02_FULL_45_16]|nr:MAG: hypothetical protein A3C51_04850 [Omnitrophica bacterium RIFCSPHIGHO2_02_FULL_46_20]OGW92807.1 MAG: hypothetical protein A3G36_05700 [Omnitrophica bacterium RIFCSPLOWO2_12_FULL_45_13]OGW93620.1 MAG: hypothetical protein A3K16_00800 [Omnitrophica bacterium RIFCSPLOWO2_01_FULL_45_24]OGX01527.1 MAG: hypothetical protein A3I73_03655 [Omnitrophica bacterium RIFCSPLOWO2_02_FULL_45_16]
MLGRPKKLRKVLKEPDTKQFSPRGHRGRPGYNELKVEEIEAIRLIDHMGLKQTEAAKCMGISQQTFSRILRNARKVLAEALVLGRIIKVGGGDFKIAVLLILMAVVLSGCASIPIPSSIPIPNEIPIVSWFL